MGPGFTPQLHPLTTVPSVSGFEASKGELMTPEHLVAIASAGEWEPVDNEGRRDILPPTLSSKPIHPILDALASLCVRKGKGEVYAVGMQFSEFNSDASGIILTIAGNGNVPEEVSSHLRALWMQLRDIAKDCYEHYKHQGTPYAITYNGDSPPSKNALNSASGMLERLGMDVFRHSLRKFVARLNKRYNAFREFSESLQKYWLQQPESDEDARINFEGADLAIRTIKEMVSIRVEDVNLDLLLTFLNKLHLLVRALLKTQRLPSWCIGVAKSKSLP